jgi:hypothetical protein
VFNQQHTKTPEEDTLKIIVQIRGGKILENYKSAQEHFL